MKLFTAVVTSVAGTLLMGGGLFLARLAHGPIPLDFMTDFVKEKAKEEKILLSFDHPVLEWKEWAHPLHLRLQNLSLKTEEVSVQAAEGEMTCSFLSLMGGRLHKISLISPILQLKETSSSGGVDPWKIIDAIELSRGAIFYEGASASFKMEQVDVSLTPRQIFLSARAFINPHLPEAPFLEEVRGHLLLKEGVLTLSKGEIVIPGVNVTFEGKAEGVDLLKKTFSKANVGVAIPVLSFQDLERYWLPSLAPHAREWVFKNMSEGDLSHIVLNVEGHSPSVFSVAGEFQLQNFTINYLTGLPFLKEVKAHTRFTEKEMIFDVTQGKTHGLTLEKGKVSIQGFDQEDQTLFVVTTLKGPLRQALEVLDHPPLGYMKKYSINPKKSAGRAQLSLDLEIPLKKEIALDDVKIKGKALLKETSLPVPLGSMGSLSLTAGDMTIDVQNDFLVAKGTANANGAPTTFTWKEMFSPSKEPSTAIEALTTTREEDLKAFGVDLKNLIAGAFPLKISYRSFPTKTSFLSLSANLDNNLLTLWGYEKKKAEKASFEGGLEFKKGRLTAIKKASLLMGSYSLRGSALFGRDKEISQLRAEIALPLTNLAISKRGPVLSFYGSEVNLIPYFSDQDGQSSKDKGSMPFSVDFNVAKVHVSPGKFLVNVHGTAEGRKEPSGIYWARADLKGQGVKAFFNLHLTPYQAGVQTLAFETTHTGELLGVFEVMDNIRGGHTFLKATREKGKPFKGTALIKDISSEHSPLLMQLMALASPTGIFELIAGESILSFSTVDCGVEFSEDKILLSKGHGRGTHVGFSLSGLIDRKRKKLDIKGTLIPAYALSEIVGSIPLVGDLLTGGGKGIFAVSFTMTGSTSHPKISVNPLTTFAPGFLRGLFSDD